MKRIILSGGGTGGHIYPAITIAREILKIEEAEILFIGTPDGMESKIIPEEGFAFASIPVSGLKRKITFDNIKILMQAIHSLFKAKAVLNKFKPDIVIGTGGCVRTYFNGCSIEPYSDPYPRAKCDSRYYK